MNKFSDLANTFITQPSNVEFEEKGCVYVKNFIDKTTIEIVSKYLENKINRGEWKEEIDELDVTKYAYYADPLIEIILIKALPEIETIVGKKLFPTYSYARIYQPNEKLRKHTDRESCEISVTVNVASKGPKSPIWMKYKNNPETKYYLDAGDAVVYKGCEALHWRETLAENQLNIQFMLHYVDQNGPNAFFEKDTRPAYGLDSFTRRI